MSNREEFHHDSVSARYREMATEKTPASLDRAVLARSRKAARSKTPASWRQAWYRPAIFIGLVGITLSVLLEVTGPDATDSTVSDIDGVFDDALVEVEEMARDAESRAQSSMRQTPATVPSMTTAETIPEANANLGDREYCSDEERITDTAWWQCIEELEVAGRHDAAESELRQLLENFPDFALPKDATIHPGQ